MWPNSVCSQVFPLECQKRSRVWPGPGDDVRHGAEHYEAADRQSHGAPTRPPMARLGSVLTFPLGGPRNARAANRVPQLATSSKSDLWYVFSRENVEVVRGPCH